MKSILIIISFLIFLLLLVFNIPRLMYWGVGYYEKENSIWYRDTQSWKWFTYSSKRIKDLDPKSFKKITKRYARDQNQVFFEGNPLENVDINSFEVILENDAYSKDKNWVYYRGKALSNDPRRFQILQAGYVKDSAQVYLFGTALKQSFHAPTFEFFEGNYQYPMDKNKITFEGKEIIGADRATFKVLENGYSKDKNRKYRFSQVVLVTE